ncbi:PilN domain-containing protein [Aliamphritea spongicola]|uniref:PilN domain-containing protein n=1 Tax=Aliamphritea spongicola TaxID=707589 RepID=UPI00196A9DAB|nr:PilN domain-containing protein [Aliamphritea spongicola]MBN3561214.1 PilN domain-containing protein [Aliamphritea spongicola]
MINTETLNHEARRLIRRAHLTILYLPDDQVLQTRLSLPARTEKHLADVIRYEMDRITPFSASDVWFDFCSRPSGISKDEIEVAIQIIPRKTVARHLSELSNHGITPDLITTAKAVKFNGQRFNVLPESEAPVFRRRYRSLQLILFSVNILLLVAALWLPWQHSELEVHQLKAELNLARSAAEDVMAVQKQAQNIADQQSVFNQYVAGYPSSLTVLAELSRQLPQHTWLQKLVIDQNAVRIWGESTDAAAIIPLLESTEVLSETRFDAPVSRNPVSGTERFVARARLLKEVENDL